LPSFGGGSIVLTSSMPIIAEAEVESERMSDLSNLELSMREFVF